MHKIKWNISNITCASCINTIKKSLEKDMQDDIKISLADGRVSFNYNDKIDLNEIKKNIKKLGYNFIEVDSKNNNNKSKNSIIFFLENNFLIKFLISLIFTLPMLLHMFINLQWLHNPYFQLILTLPVYILGIYTFGNSALKSLKNNAPNMDVLIVLGATSAFIYSVVGSIFLNNNDYLFFETTASIFTLVFLGNWLEHKSVSSTQREIKKLIKSQPNKATMIAFDDKGNEVLLEVDIKDLKSGDLFIIKSGDKIPADAKILWGNIKVNEALITGESEPKEKEKKSLIIGGSIVEEGTAKAQVTAVGDDSVLGNIIQYIRDAELEKPPIQKLADKISAIFVPIVLFISGIVLITNFYFYDISFQESLMRSIAILVIACPCALGLATPAAISVGIGRAAKNGILFRKSESLENFRHIKQIAFDKTGTLTTGRLKIKNEFTNINLDDFKQIVFSLEKHSNHPIAVSICLQWFFNSPLIWKNIKEIKGIGIEAEDTLGNFYKIGSKKLIENFNNIENNKSLYVFKNNNFIGWVDLEDEIRPEAKKVIKYFKQKNIEIFLISGDNELKCKNVANELEIKNYYYEQTPTDKILLIEKLNKISPIAMVGDGINDAPALSKATIGVSINGAAQISIEASTVILMNNSLINLPKAINLGKKTYNTIQGNLYWAFAYNIIAIPIAAFGFLSPTYSALIMGGSDVILALNSMRLYFKKIE